MDKTPVERNKPLAKSSREPHEPPRKTKAPTYLATKPMKIDGLTPNQKKYVDCYDGDVGKAAAMAGLSSSYCRHLMQDSTNKHAAPSALAVQTAIQARNEGNSRIASRQERQEFWTEEIRDQSNDKTTRLRASELLGKSELDFGERRQEVTPQSIADIAALMASHPELIEAEAIEGETG